LAEESSARNLTGVLCCDSLLPALITILRFSMERRTVLKGFGIAAAGSGPLLGIIESIAAAEIDTPTLAALPRPAEYFRGGMRYRMPIPQLRPALD